MVLFLVRISVEGSFPREIPNEYLLRRWEK